MDGHGRMYWLFRDMKSNKFLLTAVMISISLGGCVDSDDVTLDGAGAHVPKERKYAIQRFNGFSTVSHRVAQYGYRARKRLTPYFEQADVAYPPKVIVFVGLKQERRLELYAGDAPENIQFIRSYSVLGASGGLGPKLREGDHQVPEGIYRIDAMNPNSKYHLSLRVNYPNSFDRKMARIEGRRDLGGDIFIHGKAVSAGCLAMGDWVAEELFVLVADNTTDDVRIILSPIDFRAKKLPLKYILNRPGWSRALYNQIELELKKLPGPQTI